MAGPEFLDQLRVELPRLLREHAEVRHEVWGLMLEAFPSRQEFLELLRELRAFREDSNRRFEELNRRFEELNRRFEAARADTNRRFDEARADTNRRFDELRADMNRRFEEVSQRFAASHEDMSEIKRDLRRQEVHLSSLGLRVGRGLEHLVKGVVEEFAGESFPSAERLTFVDQEGEVFGVRGAEIEFDLYAHNGTAYLVEVKSHLKTGDVLSFHRKAAFAEARLGRPVMKLILALSMATEAEDLMLRLGIRYQARSITG